MIVVGGMRLGDFLSEMGQDWVLQARSILRALDWSEFEASYSAGGRSAYAPAAMMGLILYGVVDGKSSLREIESLARRDMGAMWMSGGIFPDHSVLGRFIQRHADLLTSEFFEQLTRLILTKLGSSCAVLAGDGTVIESAASRFQTLRLSALEGQVEAESTDDGDQGGSDGQDAKQADAAGDKRKKAATIARGRAEQSKKTAREKDATRVALTDPEAVYLKKKRGGYGPGYVTSFLANADRFIAAVAVDPSDELNVVPAMLEQVRRVTPSRPRRLLLDANYHRGQIFKAAVEAEVDLLCPPPPSSSDPYSKAAFRYDEAQDLVYCPQGQPMRRQSDSVDSRTGQTISQYRHESPQTCARCPVRAECTNSARGRSIRRDEVEWARQAVAEAMKSKLGQARYAQRMAMVEPVISELRGRQGLTRFARTALSGARLETFLHAAAYNLRRYTRMTAAGAALWLFLALTRAIWVGLRGRGDTEHRIFDRASFSPLPLAMGAR